MVWDRHLILYDDTSDYDIQFPIMMFFGYFILYYVAFADIYIYICILYTFHYITVLHNITSSHIFYQFAFCYATLCCVALHSALINSAILYHAISHEFSKLKCTVLYEIL